MKEATVLLKLNKETHLLKHRVTPIEALLLVAEHHKNVGDNPVEVDKATVKETTDKRTSDQELDRLRTIYAPAKVKALLTEVKDLPDDYPQAIERGLKVALPSGALSTTKII